MGRTWGRGRGESIMKGVESNWGERASMLARPRGSAFRHRKRVPPEERRSMKCMRRILSALGTTLAAALMARASLAQVNGPNVIIEPWGGYANFAKNVNIKDAPIYGGTLGLYLYRYIGLEAHLGRLTSKTFQGFTPYAIT